MKSMVGAALQQRVLVLILATALIAAGLFAYKRLNIEAYPDPVPPLVEIVTQNPGQSSEEIERYITIPIEVQMAGLPYVTSVRTISLVGLSDVKVQFTYDVSYSEASQLVINRLSQLGNLPGNAQPQLSPTSPIGEIYRYRLVGPPGYSVTDLKTVQDWILDRRFKSVPGVIDVTGWGGKLKTYDITVDFDRLLAYGLTLKQVLDGLNGANVNVGANTVNLGPQSAVIRSVGQIRSMHDIRHTMLAIRKGAPVLVDDVATVSVGFEPRLGICGQDTDDDVVQGIVLMRRGAQTLPTLNAVEREVERINRSDLLPPGVRIVRIYDRRALVDVTTRTVLHNMVMGVVLIFLVQWLFLGDLRSALIVAATIPFALLFAVTILVLSGESANLLSMGAIDFGIIVDATVIMIENIFRHLAEAGAGHRRSAVEPARGLAGKLDIIFVASGEVTRAIFFAATIIIAGFLPLFTLSGVEGHIFGPMAKTYAYALSGGLLATFTVSPVLAAFLLPEKVAETETAIVRFMRRFYRQVVDAVLDRCGFVLGAGGCLVLIAAFVASTVGLEFLPKLEEGNIWMRATMPASVSLEEGNVYVNKMRAVVKSFPEVVTVVSQNGRPDDGTDPDGFSNAEFFVPLKPFDQWRKGLDKETLIARMSDALQQAVPGVNYAFSQYIQDNVQEAASGIDAENAIKIIGTDLDQLHKLSLDIRSVLEKVPGITDVAVPPLVGQPTIRIDIDRDRAARYGLSPGDINATIQAAVGGQAAGDLYETGSDRHFPMKVRLAPQYRQSIESLRRLTIGVQASDGSVIQVPLAEVAEIGLASGAFYIYREQQERFVPVKFSVRGRDLGSAVLEAQGQVARQVPLPGGYRLEWAGDFENFQKAIDRLAIAVPIAIALILLLLYVNFGSLTDTLLAGSAIPLALIGGILALWLAGMPFSISAAIGFVALFGIAAMNGIMLVGCFNRLIEAGVEHWQAVRRTCELQMRPVMMTCVAACVGLLPAAFSTAIGSQVQRPLAIVVVGGMLLAPALFLTVLPAAIGIFSRRRVAVTSAA
ncbi:CusA/CzcA family heavy metal efflux RND transporter [Reyranella sp.]|jgi:cobalt-zinc-cadmium resistance protein CzcA|uniref:efflux RND transporter permease subunit n=1 Tax=Reyranella sp. TaxID=1929291 RepID=UPI002F952169